MDRLRERTEMGHRFATGAMVRSELARIPSQPHTSSHPDANPNRQPGGNLSCHRSSIRDTNTFAIANPHFNGHTNPIPHEHAIPDAHAASIGR